MENQANQPPQSNDSNQSPQSKDSTRSNQANAKNFVPLIVALIIGSIAAAYYFFSGQGSLDLGVRNLSNTKDIEKVSTQNPESIQVKCKNGQSYEIIFKPGQSNYDDLIFNACGSEGTQEAEG